jgi:hypothetical protein
MIISLLHPSRGRAEKAKATLDYWINASSGKHEIEHIISIDDTDDQVPAYQALFTESKLLINDNTCVVEATNIAAKASIGEIKIYLSDDFKCPENWDELLADIFSLHPGEPRLLKVNDCLQPFEVAVLTIPIMNRELYEKLGYFWHPGYRSMFVDEDLYWTCFINKWMLMCEDLRFPHEHWVNGKAPVDDTYRNSEINWDQGKALFGQRKEQVFPV